MQVSQLDKDSLNFFLSRNPLMDLPSNTLYEETSNLLGHSQLDEFKRPIKSLELVQGEKVEKDTKDDYKKTLALTLSQKGLPNVMMSKIMSQIAHSWNASKNSKRQTKFLVKYLGQSNFSKLLQVLAMYPVVKDIMQAFVTLLLKDSVTHFQVQAMLVSSSLPMSRQSHDAFIMQQPDSSPLVPISLHYMATLLDDAVKQLEGTKPRPDINDANNKIKEFYIFSYDALIEYIENCLIKLKIEKGAPFLSEEFIEFVSMPILRIFKFCMFPILNKLCELNQYKETHEEVKYIDFIDLLTRTQPTPSEYEEINKEIKAVAEIKAAAAAAEIKAAAAAAAVKAAQVKPLADQRRRFAEIAFETTKSPDDRYGGRRSYLKKNRTNKRLKKNVRIKNKKKYSSSRKIHKKMYK